MNAGAEFDESLERTVSRIRMSKKMSKEQNEFESWIEQDDKR